MLSAELMSREFDTISDDEVADILRAWHQSDDQAYDRNHGERDVFIDSLIFGKSLRAIEAEFMSQTEFMQAQVYPDQILCTGDSDFYWTPYSTSRAIVRALDLTAEDTLYDLGSGYSTLPIYAGAVTDATCKGIELLKHRVEAAHKAASRMGLGNVEITQGDALEQDISDGTVFYMFAPFPFHLRDEMMRRLGKLAETKRIRLVLRRLSGDWIHDGWLGEAKRIKAEGLPEDIEILEAGPTA